MIESPGGNWFRASHWSTDEFKALRHTIILSGYHGQYADDKLASLYRAGMHLPVESQRDWDLLEEALKFNLLGTKTQRPSSAAETFLDCLTKIAPTKAALYR